MPMHATRREDTPLPAPRPRGPVGTHLYIIQSSITGAVKIGRSTHPTKRLAELQTGSPHKLRLLAVLEGRGHEEKRLHRELARWRLRGEHGEWFSHEALPNLPTWIYEKLPFEDDWWKK